jgi:hypothetical protein
MSISVDVFLQHCAALRLQIVSGKLIDAHKVQQVLHQQPWLAGCSRTSMPCVSYADTYCACISVTDSEHSALLQDAQKFCGHAAVNSCKSGEPILHRERPHIKSRSSLTDDFKNLKSVSVP